MPGIQVELALAQVELALAPVELALAQVELALAQGELTLFFKSRSKRCATATFLQNSCRESKLS